MKGLVINSIGGEGRVVVHTYTHTTICGEINPNDAPLSTGGGGGGSGVVNERREEAYELVRRGIKADLKSHVCWHVYG